MLLKKTLKYFFYIVFFFTLSKLKLSVCTVKVYSEFEVWGSKWLTINVDKKKKISF